MKATFSAREPNILMEANPGDLFVPLGPDLVECVCAVRSVNSWPDDPRIDIPRVSALDPNVKRPVIVIACRVGKGEPEFFPTGFQKELHGSTPISFLEQVEPAAFRERASLSREALRAVHEAVFGDRAANHDTNPYRVFIDGVPYVEAVGRYAVKCNVRFDRGGEVPDSRA